MIPSAAVIFSLNVQGSGIARPREVKVTKPLLLTSYSRDTDGVLHYPGQDLRRFSLPKLPCDLNEGLTEWVQPSDAPSPSTPILDALDSVGIGPCPELHFITFRNNLNKIMETPYNTRDPWEMDVRRANGTVILDVVKLPESNNGQSQADQRKFTYWGYKFEDFCTRVDGGTGRPVNPEVEWCAVLKVSLGKSRVAMAAEIDCFSDPHGARDATHGAPGPFVELKTNRQISGDRQLRTFERNKLLRFWIQSFLAGVPQICVGFRDDAGLVHSTEMLDTLEIPRRCADFWDPRVCLDFTDRLLEQIRDNTVDGNSYKLRFEAPFQQVQLSLVDD